MYIRERGKSIILIRITYDPSRKAGRQNVIGKLDSANPDVPSSVLEACTASELTQLTEWLAVRAVAQAKAAAIETLTAAPAALAEIQAALPALADVPNRTELRSQLLGQLETLQHALQAQK